MKRFFAIIAIAAIFTLLFVFAARRDRKTETIVYREHLSETVATLEGEALTLKDLAFYVGYQEQKVDFQAQLYDPKHPKNWWNTHTNGEFLRVTARTDAVDMLLHDTYFFRRAEEAGLSLTPEETALAESAAYDFWTDLSDKGKEALGITAEDVETTCERIALAQKAQLSLCGETGLDYEAYDVGGKGWEDIKAGLKITTEDTLLSRLAFGTITIN